MSSMMALQSLSTTELFRGLNEDQLNLLASGSYEVWVEEGTTLFREGELAKYIYGLTLGGVSLEMTTPVPAGMPKTMAKISDILPGEAFGWSALVQPNVYTLTATTTTRSLLLKSEAAALREVLKTDREICYTVMTNLTKLIGNRLQRTRRVLLFERWASPGGGAPGWIDSLR